MASLLDVSVLIALSRASHVHHAAAHRWRERQDDKRFATCPITEGALLRFLLREGEPVTRATWALRQLASLRGHEFWADDVSYTDVDLRGVFGHRQVTDAYLAQLVRAKGGRLATFDAGLAALHDDVAVLVPTE